MKTITPAASSDPATPALLTASPMLHAGAQLIVRDMPVSATLVANEAMAARRHRGQPVLPLAFGEAGLPVHPALRDALAAAAASNSYGPVGAARVAISCRRLLAAPRPADPLASCRVRAWQQGVAVRAVTGDRRRRRGSAAQLGQLRRAGDHDRCAPVLRAGRARRRRNLGLLVPPPQAAFYVYPDFEPWRDHLMRRHGVTTSAGLAGLLLNRYGAATLPGSAFGDDPAALRLRLATALLYGDSDSEREAALAAPDPLALPWIGAALARLTCILAELTG